MEWVKIKSEDSHLIEDGKFYLVKTNGDEWHDHDLGVWAGYLVKARMKPECVRGRPTHVILIVRPT